MECVISVSGPMLCTAGAQSGGIELQQASLIDSLTCISSGAGKLACSSRPALVCLAPLRCVLGLLARLRAASHCEPCLDWRALVYAAVLITWR